MWDRSRKVLVNATTMPVNHANHVKLIAMDIDGTLVDVGSRVSEENARAIAEAAARGIEIVLVTGRRFDFARSIADQVPCDLFMINSNGAVVKSKSGESHLTHLMDAGLARRVLDSDHRISRQRRR